MAPRQPRASGDAAARVHGMGSLNVWMNGELVGLWSGGRGKANTFRYDPAWVASPHGRALSLSIPISFGDQEVRGPVVEHYFDNLLPDHDAIRKRIQRRFRTDGTEAFELLAAIGRDCVGAVQLLPPGEQPTGFDRIESEALDDGQVEQQLLSVTSDNPLGPAMANGAQFRISIAGAQEKTALLRLDGRWRRPLGMTPTTHILKLPLGLVGGRRMDMTHSVENEWLCAQILKELGFAVAAAEMATFGATKALVVERFDRQFVAGKRGRPWIVRLPQEDFCQATGESPSRKYEQDGGPGIARCLQVLSASDTASSDQLHFAATQLAFWLLAATDGHAKNFSIFNLRGSAFRMTPLYDVLSAWPIVGSGPSKLPLQKVAMAMALRGKNVHYKMSGMQPRHWQELASQAGGSAVWARMLELVEAAPAAVARALDGLPDGFPVQVAKSIAEGVAKQAQTFRRALDRS
jgi:serine/threonine-protein kinase HipA